MSGLTATTLYGPAYGQLQPTASPSPDHQGAPEPTMATKPAPPRSQSPILLVVLLLGAVVLLTQLSFRGTVQVRA